MAVETFEASWRGPKAVSPEDRQKVRRMVKRMMRAREFSAAEIRDTIAMLGLEEE